MSTHGEKQDIPSQVGPSQTMTHDQINRLTD